MKRALQVAGLAGLCLSCSAIGDPGGMPDGLPHGGTGLFRLLDSEESGIAGLPGRALALRNVALESAMRADDFLFHTHQPLVDEPPTPPDDFPANEVFQDAFGERSIYRAARFTEGGTGAFAPGTQVLSASEAWEGGEVFDPWVLIDEDGAARLYYAGAGGIGLATASSVDGSFSKQSGPIITPEAMGVARRPTVVIGPDDAYWMYYDTGDGIAVARSEDGASFSPMSFSVSGLDETDDTFEVRLANPGAARVDTAAERTLIRLYVESVRDDGSRLIYLLASEDGETFDRFPRPVMDQTDVRHPAPYIVDERVTFLYTNFPFTSGGFQTRAVTVAVAPAGERFDPDPETM